MFILVFYLDYFAKQKYILQSTGKPCLMLFHLALLIPNSTQRAVRFVIMLTAAILVHQNFWFHLMLILSGAN